MGMPMGMQMGVPMGVPMGTPMGTPMGVPMSTQDASTGMPLQHGLPMQYGMPDYSQMQIPSMPGMQYGMFDYSQMQIPSMPPSYEQPIDMMQFSSLPIEAEMQPVAQPNKGVELLGLRPLVIGDTVCSQASSGQWWDAEVFHDNSDFTYFLIVKDDMQTQWPRVHWSDIIDRSCADFYQGELDRENGEEDQHQEQQQWAEQQQQWQEQELQQEQWQEQELQQEQQQQEMQKSQRFPTGKKEAGHAMESCVS